MKHFINCIRADGYKVLHSKLLLIHLLVPIMVIVAFCGYYSYSPWQDADKIVAFAQGIAMGFPFIVSIVVTMLYDEEEAGNFQVMLSAPYPKEIVHFSKLFTLIVLGSVSVLVTAIGFGAISQINGMLSIPFNVYVLLAFSLIFSNIGIYLIQYMVVFSLGRGVSLGLGVIGSLLSALFSLGLGDSIWRFFPCAWGIRMASYLVHQKMGDITLEKIVIWMAQDYHLGKITILIATIVTFVIFCFWGRLWQGSYKYFE